MLLERLQQINLKYFKSTQRLKDWENINQVVTNT